MKADQVLVLGGVSWNTMLHLARFPAPEPATITDVRGHEAAGSTGMGKALALKAMGFDPWLHATLGDDELGARIRAAAAARGLRTHFDLDPSGTSRHVNLMDAQGRRISLMLHNGSPRPPVAVDAIAPRIAAAEAIFLNITPSSLPLLPAVRASSAEVWVDLHDYDGRNTYHAPFIEAADVIQCSDEAVAEPEPLMAELVRGVRLVVCTRGAQGALALDAQGQWHQQPALPVRLVDSNGAGDVHMVALWAALRRGAALPQALREAAAAASLALETDELAPADLRAEAIARRLDA